MSSAWLTYGASTATSAGRARCSVGVVSPARYRHSARRALQHTEADERAAERQERLVHVCPTLVANCEAAEAVEPGERALHDPAISPKALARLDTSSGDPRSDPASTERQPTAWVVIPFVGVELLGPPARPTTPPRERAVGSHLPPARWWPRPVAKHPSPASKSAMRSRPTIQPRARRAPVPDVVSVGSWRHC